MSDDTQAPTVDDTAVNQDDAGTANAIGQVYYAPPGENVEPGASEDATQAFDAGAADDTQAGNGDDDGEQTEAVVVDQPKRRRGGRNKAGDVLTKQTARMKIDDDGNLAMIDVTDGTPVPVRPPTQLAMTFDYDTLAPEVREIVLVATREIRRRARRAVEDIVAIGQHLSDVRDNLPDGTFGKWLEAELQWASRRTAYNFMAVYERFGAMSDFLMSSRHLDVGAMYVLAYPSTPDHIAAHFIDKGRAERVTRDEVREAIRAWRVENGLADEADPEPNEGVAAVVDLLAIPFDVDMAGDDEEDAEEPLPKPVLSKPEKAAKMIAAMGWLTDVQVMDVVEHFDDIQLEAVPEICGWFAALQVAIVGRS